MLKSNGRAVQERRNYHMTQGELKILLEWLREHSSMQYYTMVLLQFSMGLRASELCSIHILDWSEDFTRLTYRAAKTNEVRTNEPVPEPVAKFVKEYVVLNAHRMRDGWMWPNSYNPQDGHLSPKAYEAAFSKWRQKIGKDHPRFLDCYDIPVGQGACQRRYRICTHSLRRLHRTVLKHNIDDLWTVKELCHYKDWSSFQRYINFSEVHEKKANIVNNVFNPIVLEVLQN